MSDALVDGKKGTVENYRAGGNVSYSKDDEGNLVREISGEPTEFYVGVRLDGEDDVRYIPWQKVMDTQGLPMITAPEGVKESPEYKEEKPNTETEEAQEEKPSSNRKYSLDNSDNIGIM